MDAQRIDEKRQAFEECVLKHKLSPVQHRIVKIMDALFIWNLTNYLFPGLFGFENGQFKVFVWMFVAMQIYFLYVVIKIIQMGHKLEFTLEQQSEILKILFPRESWKKDVKRIVTFFTFCFAIADVTWFCWKLFNGIQTQDPFNPFYVVILLQVFDILFLACSE